MVFFLINILPRNNTREIGRDLQVEDFDDVTMNVQVKVEDIFIHIYTVQVSYYVITIHWHKHLMDICQIG